jgi:hypothetical protein
METNQSYQSQWKNWLLVVLPKLPISLNLTGCNNVLPGTSNISADTTENSTLPSQLMKLVMAFIVMLLIFPCISENSFGQAPSKI